jgi:hypothetical protein
MNYALDSDACRLDVSVLSDSAQKTVHGSVDRLCRRRTKGQSRYSGAMDILGWLLDSDPAIRWQAMLDLTGAAPAAVAAERPLVARHGIGARILALQHPDGSWRQPGSPIWLPTLFTLLLLRAAGADHTEPLVESAVALLESTLAWTDLECWELRPIGMGGNRFFTGEVEPCINGGVLALGAYLGRPTESLALRLVGEQLADGGWNCDAPKSRRSSFHTTICVLEGLLEYEKATESDPRITQARIRGEEYLLERSLFRRRSTGEIIDPAFLEFAFPPRYHYDVLRALDYFRATGRPPDPRMGEAIDLLVRKRRPDGRWLLDQAYEEALPLPVGESVGEPSRWNTLRALRVLRWYQQAR